MSIEQTVKADSQVFLRREKFHEIFQRALSPKSGSRPPKIELTGILVPLAKKVHKPFCKFKLESDHAECVLKMGYTILMLADKMHWEEVTVKGYLDSDEGVFEVEKISLSKSNEPYRLFLSPTDLYLELDQYKKSISHKGLLEVAPDFLVS